MQSQDSDEKWKNHLIWKHGMKTLFPKQFTKQHSQTYPRILNRYYHNLQTIGLKPITIAHTVF